MEEKDVDEVLLMLDNYEKNLKFMGIIAKNMLLIGFYQEKMLFILM